MGKIFLRETPLMHRDLSPQVRLRIILWRLLTLGVAATLIVLARGFPEHPFSKPVAVILGRFNIQVGILYFNHLLQFACFVIYNLDFWGSYRAGRLAATGSRPDWLDGSLSAMGLLMAVCFVLGFGLWTWAVFEVVLVIFLMMELWRFNVGLSRKLRRPGLMLPMSFITLIAVATPILKVPLAIAPGTELSWLDALFTITSAACVTGLIVQDTATHFTPFGQAVIAVVIQVGGLGMIIFGTVVAALVGDRMSLSENLSLSAALNGQPLSRLQGLVRLIVGSTLLIELIGAALLLPMWDGPLGIDQRIGLSLFHSVSAFCNAGFALYTDSMIPYRYAPLLHLVLGPLIVLGGLGFPVLDNLFRILRWRIVQRLAPRSIREARRPNSLADSRLSLHSKLVLSTTLGLYLFGVVFLSVAQFRPYLDPLTMEQPVPIAQVPALKPLTTHRVAAVLVDASFQSITARTAGFNSMPMEEIRSGGNFTLMGLMMVGASPGGTGGGAKTTTLALLLLSVVATLKARNSVEAYGRRISDVLLRQAATLAGCYIVLVGASTFLLSLSEPYPFIALFFESISAATTTGLSMLKSDEVLSSFGKSVIIATMYLGRVGPLSLLGALVFSTLPPRPYQFPQEDVLVG